MARVVLQALPVFDIKPAFTFTFLKEPPFVEIKNKSLKREDVAGKVVDGDLQGFLIDLIRALAKEAKFEYDLYLRSDSGYQKMIDELTRQVNANASSILRTYLNP